MILTRGGASVTIPNFNWGYSTEIEFPFNIVKLGNRKINTYDAGNVYDKYNCKGKVFLSASQVDDFFDFYNNTARGLEIILSGTGSTGFYPFTNAVNETEYTIYLDDIKNMGMADDAGKIFEIELVFRWKFPTSGGTSTIDWNDPLSGCNEGSLSFAGLDNLIFPQSGFKPKKEYSVSVQNYRGAQFYGHDTATTLSDRWEESIFSLGLRGNEASNLIYRIINVYRGNNIPIQGADNYFIFGYDRGDNTLFNVKLSEEKLKIKHTSYNNFEIEFKVVKQ